MKHIILLNSLRSGGAERQVSYLIKYISIIDRVFTLEWGNFYTLKGIEVNNLSSGYARFFIIKYIAILIKCFRCIIKNDIILSFAQRSNYLNILLVFFTKHLSVISERTTPSRVFRKGFQRFHFFLIPLLYPFSKKIIANSLGVKNDLVENFNIPSQKIIVIYNAFDEKEIVKSIQSDLSISNYTLATIGRFDESKGHWHLLRIMANLKKMQQRCALAIIGDGKYRRKLIHYCNALGLRIWHQFVDEPIPSQDNADVYFLGLQDNPFKYIAQAKLFVLPSLYEGFPNVVVESMICGTPVMSSDCRSGPREIFAPDTDFRYETKVPEYAKYGILMPVPDGIWRKADEPLTETEQIWANEIIKVLQNNELRERYSRLGKARAQDFSVENIIPQWERVIREVEDRKLQ